VLLLSGSALRDAGRHCVQGSSAFAVEEDVERLGLPARSTPAYACGHPGMIEDMARRLTPRGFLVKEEKYWKE
jgi:NAD(P)H-flavin reductase